MAAVVSVTQLNRCPASTTRKSRGAAQHSPDEVLITSLIEEDLTESTRLAQSSHDMTVHIQSNAHSYTVVCLPDPLIDSDTLNKHDKSFQN